MKTKTIPEMFSTGELITYSGEHIKDVAIVVEVSSKDIHLLWSLTGLQTVTPYTLRYLVSRPNYRYFGVAKQ